MSKLKEKKASTSGIPQSSKTKLVKVAKIKTDKIKTQMIRARIDPILKGQAETILSKLGLNASDAIRLFYTQITLENGLPFPVKIPNVETRKAILEADAGKVTRYASADEMFKKLGI